MLCSHLIKARSTQMDNTGAQKEGGEVGGGWGGNQKQESQNTLLLITK